MKTQTATLHHSWTIGATMVNEIKANLPARLTAAVSASLAGKTERGQHNSAFPAHPGIRSDYGTPSFSGAGDKFLSLGAGRLRPSAAEKSRTTYEYGDDWSLIKGRHVIKVGADFRHENLNMLSHNLSRGAFAIPADATAALDG